MVLLESTQSDLNTKQPSFSLSDPFGNTVTRDSALGEKGLLIVFTCNHCPYAIAVWDRIIQLSIFAKEKGINTVAINPNIHPNYPDDSPEAMKVFIAQKKLPFPYLVDEKQSVAKAYGAVCTPDIFLVTHESTLFYHGRIDDNWKDPSLVTKEELKQAIKALSGAKEASKQQYPTMGCSIKWLD
jgi:peroxiredoxin